MDTLLEQATPRPWYWEPASKLLACRIGSEGHRRGVGDYAFQQMDSWPTAPEPVNAEANAELIVRAVNAYEPLVKALDRLTEASHIILINEVPSDEAWRDFSEAYDGAMTALATVESSPEREGGE